MARRLTTEDVDELFEASNRQIRDESSVFHRYLMDEIDWRDRLICIKGPRGVVNDGVSVGRGNKIPLWLFGFLY